MVLRLSLVASLQERLVEVDAGVDEHVADVGEEVAGELEEAGEGEDGHEDGVVVPGEGVEAEAAHAGDFEDGFDDDAAGEEYPEDAAKPRGDGDEGVA